MPRKPAANWALSTDRSSPPGQAEEITVHEDPDITIDPDPVHQATAHWSNRAAGALVKVPALARGESWLSPVVGRGQLEQADALAGLIRFIVVGSLATTTYLVSALLLQLTTLGPQTGSAIAIAISVVVSFVMQSRVTFQTGRLDLSEAARFGVIGITGLVVSRVLIGLIHLKAGMPFWVGALAVCLVVPVANFVAMNFWVFSNGRTKTSQRPD